MFDDESTITYDVDDVRRKKKTKYRKTGGYWDDSGATMYYDSDDAKSNKKTTYEKKGGMTLFGWFAIAIICFRLLMIFQSGSDCRVLEYWMDCIAAFLFFYCLFFELIGFLETGDFSGFNVNYLFISALVGLLVLLFLLFMSALSSRIYQPSDSVWCYPVDGDDILTYRVKSEWNKFLDFIGLSTYLEDILLDKPYYTGDEEEGLESQEENYNNAINKMNTEGKEDWAQEWPKDKIRSCFIFDKNIREGMYEGVERYKNAETSCNSLDGLEQINNMFNYDQKSLIKPPDPNSFDNMDDVIWKRMEVPVGQDCESYVYQTSWLNKNNNNLDRIIRSFPPPKYLFTKAFKNK